MSSAPGPAPRGRAGSKDSTASCTCQDSTSCSCSGGSDIDPNSFGIYGRYEDVSKTTTHTDAAPTRYAQHRPGAHAWRPVRFHNHNHSHSQQQQQATTGIAQEPHSDLADQIEMLNSRSDQMNHQPSYGSTGDNSIDSSKIDGDGEKGPTLGYLAAHQMTRKHPSDFEMAHGAKQGGYIAAMGSHIPIKMAHLFKRPLVRQWIHDGKIYRETSERTPSRFELFFDLVFVAIQHRCADGAAVDASAMNVAKFAVVFYLCWSVWLDVRTYINQSGTDDVWQRLYILLMMILLAGFAGNATAITIADIRHTLAAGAAEGADATATGSSEGGANQQAARAVLAGASWIASRASEAVSAEPEIDLNAHLLGSYYFTVGWHEALFWAIAFFLIAKCARLLLSFSYGLLLPRFRKALWLQGLFVALIATVFLPLMFVQSTDAVMLLCVIGVTLDISMKYVIAAASQWLHGQTKHRGHHTFFPAVSVEHLQERMLLFSILVIGESILNSTYTADASSFGFSEQFGRCALGIIISFTFMWLCFDADGSRTYVHALRRHWLPAITFTNVYYPLCASMILMSSALSKLIGENDVAQGYLWIFGGSLSCAMACVATMAFLHESLDLHGSALASTKMRILVRYLVAVIFALIPLKQGWTATHFLAVYACILMVVVAFETLGKLGAIGRVYDAERAAALEQWRTQRSPSKSSGSRTPPMQQSDLELGHTAGANAPMRTQTMHSRTESVAKSMRNVKNFWERKYDKSYDCPCKPTAKDEWHAYEDLSYDEKGEEDVGNEGELGDVEARQLIASRRWALASL